MRRYKRKKIKKRTIIIATIVCLSFTLITAYSAFSTVLTLTAKGNIDPRKELYVSSLGSDDTGNGTITKPYKTLQKAYNQASSEATIYIMNNITVTNRTLFEQNKKIILTSYNNNAENYSIIRGNDLTDTLIYTSAGELIIKNITIDGNNVEAKDALVYLMGTSHFIMEESSVLQNSITSEHGGAVRLHDNQTATFTLNDGQIINNTAAGSGAIHVGKGNNVIINGGIIRNNKALTGNGGAIGNWGTMTINNGEITNNSSPGYGGAIYSNGTSTLTINNAIIKENTANIGGGISVGTSTFTPSFTLTGGKIMNNTAKTTDGGISISSNATYTYKNGTICGNNPSNSYETSMTCPT